MNTVFKKMNYKDQPSIVIVNAPSGFEKAYKEMQSVTNVSTVFPSGGELHFVIAFVTKQQEVNMLTERIVPRLSEDGILWFAYPKGSSRKYKCEFNRDSGWALLGKHNFEPVRMVAIDEDWSALRFRHVDNIKVMTRSRTISDAGSKKATPQKKVAEKSLVGKKGSTRRSKNA